MCNRYTWYKVDFMGGGEDETHDKDSIKVCDDDIRNAFDHQCDFCIQTFQLWISVNTGGFCNMKKDTISPICGILVQFVGNFYNFFGGMLGLF